jgi:hypothetical protein
MDSGFHDFFVKYCQAHRWASPLASGEQNCGTKARAASLLACIDAKTPKTIHFNLTQPDLK